MLLTVAWGGSVLAGRCDLGPSVSAANSNVVLTQPEFTLSADLNAPSGILHEVGVPVSPGTALQVTNNRHPSATVGGSGSVKFGGCVVPQGRAVDKKLTHPTNLAGTGVTTDKFTPLNAVIMSLTVLLYLVIQASALLLAGFTVNLWSDHARRTVESALGHSLLHRRG